MLSRSDIVKHHLNLRNSRSRHTESNATRPQWINDPTWVLADEDKTTRGTVLFHRSTKSSLSITGKLIDII
jgi:hypothetical protein